MKSQIRFYWSSTKILYRVGTDNILLAFSRTPPDTHDVGRHSPKSPILPSPPPLDKHWHTSPHRPAPHGPHPLQRRENLLCCKSAIFAFALAFRFGIGSCQGTPIHKRRGGMRGRKRIRCCAEQTAWYESVGEIWDVEVVDFVISYTGTVHKRTRYWRWRGSAGRSALHWPNVRGPAPSENSTREWIQPKSHTLVTRYSHRRLSNELRVSLVSKFKDVNP
jgi:hypothetical protein